MKFLKIINFKILKNRSGASLVFVLAAMLLLMQIGISVMLAASTNAGAGINEQVADQVNLYADSVQKSIMYSLQINSDDETKNIETAKTLGGQLLGAIYTRAQGSPSGPVEIEAGITPQLSDDPDLLLDVVQEVTVKIMSGSVSTAPLQPEAVLVNAKATVTVAIKHGEKLIKTAASYEFKGGRLLKGTENIMIEKAGKWVLLSYENMDVQNDV